MNWKMDLKNRSSVRHRNTKRKEIRLGLEDREQTFSLEHQSECRASDGDHAIFEKKKKSGNLPELKSKEAHSLHPPPGKNNIQQKRAAKIKRKPHLNIS